MSQSVLCTRRQFQNFPWEQACPNSHWVARSSEGVPRSIASDVGGTNFCGLNLMRFFSQYISTTLIFLMVEIILMFVVWWKSSNFQLSLSSSWERGCLLLRSWTVLSISTKPDFIQSLSPSYGPLYKEDTQVCFSGFNLYSLRSWQYCVGARLKFWQRSRVPEKRSSTLGTRGFSRVRREFSVLAEGRHIFDRTRKPR